MPRVTRADAHRLDVEVTAEDHAAIAAEAKANKRSVRAEAAVLLREALAARAKRRR